MGRIARKSIRDVGRIIRDPVTVENVAVFPSEAMVLVVQVLVADVVPNVRVVKWRDAECAIPMLPPKITSMWEAVMDPFGRGRLDAVDQFSQGESDGRLQVEMYVIPRTSGGKKFPTPPGDHRCRARVQPGPPFRIQPRSSILGSPHQMNPKREIGIGHRLIS